MRPLRSGPCCQRAPRSRVHRPASAPTSRICAAVRPRGNAIGGRRDLADWSRSGIETTSRSDWRTSSGPPTPVRLRGRFPPRRGVRTLACASHKPEVDAYLDAVPAGGPPQWRRADCASPCAAGDSPEEPSRRGLSVPRGRARWDRSAGARLDQLLDEAAERRQRRVQRLERLAVHGEHVRPA